jgi:hypothetical protein
MGLLPARPRLLALGEPTHGEDVLLEVRNDLYRQLVEQEAYRTIAIESDCMAGLIVNDCVTSGTGSLDDVMERGFSHGFGGSAANRELVHWMRAYNDGRPTSEQVRFAGFNGPLEMTGAESPRQALTALHAHLAARGDGAMLPCPEETLDRLLGDDGRWTEPAATTNKALRGGALRMRASSRPARGPHPPDEGRNPLPSARRPRRSGRAGRCRGARVGSGRHLSGGRMTQDSLPRVGSRVTAASAGHDGGAAHRTTELRSDAG